MAGVGILANGVTEILKRLSILVANEIGLAWGVKDDLQNLKKTLDMILALMIDAEKKQVTSKTVRLWLEELKDIAYEAEDIVDEYSYEVIHQSQLTRKRDKVRNFGSSSNPVLFHSKIAHEIKNINEKFNEIAKRKESLGLQIIELGTTSRTTNLDESSKLIRETDSILDQSLRIVGRDNDKSNIINKLLYNNNPHNQDENILVIPIVGMGGLGKTTLAQLIYNDDKVKRQFDLKMWVCVSDDFDVKKLFMKIIESITNNKCEDVSNIDVIARQLQQHLSGKKYLLVLDDVWNKKREEWVRFKKPLLVGGNGSKILVTTRSDKVASIMGGELHSYKLGILEEYESWSLFKERTFGYVGGAVETPTLTAIGKELVKKCGGLPLAIIFLGSLMRSKKEENEWNDINENKIWEQSSDENESGILPVLKLSYDNLSSHVKQCFSSYLSLYPKNTKFYRRSIIQVWMAEGFLLQPPGGTNLSMEEVGNEYFNSLLCNSFFQDVEKDEVGQVTWFKIHDLVHDLAKYVAGDRECLVLDVDENMESIPSHVRRLKLIKLNEGMSKTVGKILGNKPELRTLLVLDDTIKKIGNNFFDGIQRLRVLDLQEATNIEEISSSSMSNLKHLRFLDLSCTKITNLPESVTGLYHLQTLRLNGCVNLKELPKGIERLINLRHLVLPEDINMPREIGCLSSLQSLYPFNVGNKIYNNNKDRGNTGSGGRGGGGCGIEVLEGLNLLNGALKINHLRNVTSGIDAERANLKRKKNLNKILLSWHTLDSAAREEECEYDNNNNDEVVLEALQPHPNLKLLVIDQYFGAKLPWWMGAPSCLPNLVVLELIHCTKCEQLVGYGKLPSLKVLQLWKMDGIKHLGNEFYYNSGGGGGGVGGGDGDGDGDDEAVASTPTISVLFPLLKQLVLSEMGSLEEWVDIPPPTPTVAYSCFRYLEKIDIYRCPNLKITPTRFPSLKDLNLQEINERVAMPLITTNLNSLHSVELGKISDLRFLPHRLLQGNNLKVLKVIDCLDFQGFLPQEEEGLQQQAQSSTTQLLSLLNLPVLKYLPDIRSFTSLEYLYIEDCESFKPVPEDLTCLSSLQHLKLVQIRNVKESKDFEWQK